MGLEASKTYLKAGDVSSAIKCCTDLNFWDKAMELAKKHQLKNIDILLNHFSNHLIQKEDDFGLCELYHNANWFNKSVQVLFKKAESFKGQKTPLEMKKIFVLAALENEKYLKSNKNSDISEDILEREKNLTNTNIVPLMDNCWKGAEAYHFYLLAQRKIYEEKYDEAFILALRLEAYQEIIGVEKVQAIIALTSFHTKNTETCSNAFIVLEGLEDGLKYQEMAVDLFSQNEPTDQKNDIICNNCGAAMKLNSLSCSLCNSKFNFCIATGKTILGQKSFACSGCKHHIIEKVLERKKYCPLCHSTL
jgi:WD repeat-containing protein 35